jgi:hypothetical protein
LTELTGSANAKDVSAIMQSVSSDPGTMWTSVYNLSTGDFSIVYRRHYADAYRDQLPARE